MYNRACYNTLTYNSTVDERRIGGAVRVTGKPKKLKYRDFVYEINVVGSVAWDVKYIYKLLGKIRLSMASLLVITGSSKHKTEIQYSIFGSQRLYLSNLFTVKGNRQSSFKLIKGIEGSTKHTLITTKELFASTIYKYSSSNLIKGNKKVEYKEEKKIKGKRDLVSILTLTDIL